MSLVRFMAVVRPQRTEAVCQQLAANDQVKALQAWEARGSGRAAESGPAVFDVLPKAIIEGYVDQAYQDEVVDIILGHARTGRPGDGKILLMPLG